MERNRRHAGHSLFGGHWLCGFLLLAGLALATDRVVPARAEEPAAKEEEEPELEGEERKEHERQVREIVTYLRKEKNQELVHARIRQLGVEGTRVARDALVEYATDNKNHEFTQYAFRSLAKIGGKTAIEFLCSKEALLEDKNTRVREYAARGLGHTKREAALPALREALEEEKAFTVKQACMAAMREIQGG